MILVFRARVVAGCGTCGVLGVSPRSDGGGTRGLDGRRCWVLSPVRGLLLVAVGVLVWLLPVPGLVLAQTPVAAPTIASVTPGDGSLTVGWTAPVGVAGVTAYDLRYIETSADETVDSNWTVVEDFWVSGGLYGVFAGLANGTGYDVQVRAVAATDGAWSVSGTGTPAEHGDTTATATTLVLGTPLGGSIDPSTDEDYFELELSSAAAIVIRTTGGLDTVGELLDSGGVLLESNDDGGLPESPENFVIWRAAQAGTYYVKVTGDGTATGPYVLHATVIGDTSSRSNAITVNLDSSTLSLFDGPKDTSQFFQRDTDYFRLSLSEERDLLIRTSGSVTDSDIELLDSNGVKIAENEYGFLLPGIRHAVLRRSLGAGTYFIKVSEPLYYTGVYTLHVNTVTEPGDTSSDATPLLLHRAEGGRIDPASDADYFRISTLR